MWDSDYLSTIEHIAGIRRSTLSEGKATGTSLAEVTTGSGLVFDVLPGRGMDVSALLFKGFPLHFSSQTGVVHPRYFDPGDRGMLRGFFGGFLTTCGLRNAGFAGWDDGEEFGLHGRISNTEAEDVSVAKEWSDGVYSLELRGILREAAFRGEDFVLSRRYATSLGSNGFTINDRIVNRSRRSEPLLLLYHFNFGYPFIGRGASCTIPAREAWRVVDARTELRPFSDCFSKVEFSTALEVDDGLVLVHRADAVEGTTATVEISNAHCWNDRGLRLRLSYSTEELPRLSTFHVQQKGCYVFCVEPGTVTVQGREAARKRGELLVLEPDEEYPVTIQVEVEEI